MKRDEFVGKHIQRKSAGWFNVESAEDVRWLMEKFFGSFLRKKIIISLDPFFQLIWTKISK